MGGRGPAASQRVAAAGAGQRDRHCLRPAGAAGRAGPRRRGRACRRRAEPADRRDGGRDRRRSPPRQPLPEPLRGVDRSARLLAQLAVEAADRDRRRPVREHPVRVPAPDGAGHHRPAAAAPADRRRGRAREGPAGSEGGAARARPHRRHRRPSHHRLRPGAGADLDQRRTPGLADGAPQRHDRPPRPDHAGQAGRPLHRRLPAGRDRDHPQRARLEGPGRGCCRRCGR